jgi:Na+-driven multidrug efflux pump
MMTSMGANGALRGQGEAKKSSSILIVISLVNAVLDPLLIFGWGPVPGFGIAGAGYATAGANLVGVFYGLWLVSTSELRFDPRKCLTGGVAAGMAEIGKVGMPASVANAVNPAGLSVLTAIIAKHGDAAVAAFGAAGRLQAFSVVPLLALSSSIGPIVGQNWGADKVGRARDALRLSGLTCVGYGLAVAVPLSIFGESIGGWFTDDRAVIDGIAQYLLIASWAFFAYGLLIVSNGALNAIDKSKRALGVSVARVAGAVWVARVGMVRPRRGLRGRSGRESAGRHSGLLARLARPEPIWPEAAASAYAKIKSSSVRLAMPTPCRKIEPSLPKSSVVPARV